MTLPIKIKPLYIGITICLVVIFLPGYAKFMELRARNSDLEKEIEHLEHENVSLNHEKKRLEEDIYYIEKVARESMGVAKEGEIPVEIRE